MGSEMCIRERYITLHIGLGTFRPVQVEDLNRHQMDSEYFEVSPKTAMAINEARKSTGKSLLSEHQQSELLRL